MADKKHPNDDYIDPVPPTSAAAIPPDIDGDVLEEQRDEVQKPGGIDRAAEKASDAAEPPARTAKK